MLSHWTSYLKRCRISGIAITLGPVTQRSAGSDGSQSRPFGAPKGQELNPVQVTEAPSAAKSGITDDNYWGYHWQAQQEPPIRRRLSFFLVELCGCERLVPAQGNLDRGDGVSVG